MARFELPELTAAGLGEGSVTADTMFELGMMYSSGREVPIDLIIAHKTVCVISLAFNESNAS